MPTPRFSVGWLRNQKLHCSYLGGGRGESKSALFLPPPHSVGMERERYLRQRKPQLDHINHNMTNNDSFTLARLRIEREGDASGEKRHPGPRKGGLCSKTQHRGRKPGLKESSNTYRCYYSSNPQFPPEHGLFEWTFQLLNLRRSDSSVPA